MPKESLINRTRNWISNQFSEIISKLEKPNNQKFRSQVADIRNNKCQPESAEPIEFQNSVILRILYLRSQFAHFNLKLLKSSQNISQELEQYRVQVIAPLSRITKEFETFEINNLNQLDKLVDMIKSINDEPDKEKCRLLIEEFYLLNRILKNDAFLSNLLIQLNEIFINESKIRDQTSSSCQNPMESKIFKDCQNTIASLKKIKSQITKHFNIKITSLYA